MNTPSSKSLSRTIRDFSEKLPPCPPAVRLTQVAGPDGLVLERGEHHQRELAFALVSVAEAGPVDAHVVFDRRHERQVDQAALLEGCPVPRPRPRQGSSREAHRRARFDPVREPAGPQGSHCGPAPDSCLPPGSPQMAAS